MKLLVTFAVLCLGCCCLAKFDQEQAKLLAGLAKSCYAELDLPEDSDMLLRGVKNEFNFTETEVRFIVCTCQKFGIMNTEGDFNSQKIKDFLLKSNTFDQQDVIDLVDLCLAQRPEATAEEKGKAGYKCVMANKKFSFV